MGLFGSKGDVIERERDRDMREGGEGPIPSPSLLPWVGTWTAGSFPPTSVVFDWPIRGMGERGKEGRGRKKDCMPGQEPHVGVSSSFGQNFWLCFLCLCLCLSVCLSFSLSLYIYISLSWHLSIYLSLTVARLLVWASAGFHSAE